MHFPHWRPHDAGSADGLSRRIGAEFEIRSLFANAASPGLQRFGGQSSTMSVYEPGDEETRKYGCCQSTPWLSIIALLLAAASGVTCFLFTLDSDDGANYIFQFYGAPILTKYGVAFLSARIFIGIVLSFDLLVLIIGILSRGRVRMSLCSGRTIAACGKCSIGFLQGTQFFFISCIAVGLGFFSLLTGTTYLLLMSSNDIQAPVDNSSTICIPFSSIDQTWSDLSCDDLPRFQADCQKFFVNISIILASAFGLLIAQVLMLCALTANFEQRKRTCTVEHNH